MPYVYFDDGTFDWVDSEIEAEKQSSPAPQAATATVDKPTPEKKEDTGNKEFEEKYLKGFEPTPEPEPREPVKEETWRERRGLGLKGPEKEPTLKDFAEGTKRVLGGSPVLIPNALVGGAEVGGAHQFKAQSMQTGAVLNVWDSILGTKMGEKYEKEASEAIDPYLESLRTTGADTLGRQPGWKPNWVGGTLLSKDGELFRELFGPAHWGEELLQDLGSAFLFDLGVNKVFKGIGLVSQAGRYKGLKGFYSHTAKKEFGKALDDLGAFTLRELAPDIAESFTFFRPDAPSILDEKRFWVQSLPTQEMQEYAWSAIRAESDLDFDYNAEQLKEAGFGVVGIVFLRTAMMLGNKVWRNAKSGMPPREAIEKGSKEVAQIQGPEMDNALDLAVQTKAAEDEGIVTRNIERNIDKAGRDISLGVREGSRKFAEVKAIAEPQLNRLLEELEQIPVDDARFLQLEDEIGELSEKLNISKVEEIDQRLAQAEAELKDVIEFTEQANVWTNEGWKRHSNRIDKLNDKVADLARLQDFYFEFEEAANNIQARIAKSSEIEGVTTQLENAGIGFNNALNDARILVDSIEEALERRSRLIDLQESALVRDPKSGIESTGKYHQFPGELGEAYRELKDLLQTSETVLAAGNLDEDTLKQLITRADEINAKIVDNGGLAEVINEDLDELKRIKDETPTSKTEKKDVKQEEQAPSDTPEIPKIKAPLEEDPVTGKVGIDVKEVGAREGIKPETPVRPLDTAEEIKSINKDFDVDQVPDPEELHEGIIETTQRRADLQALDDIDGGQRAKEAVSMKRGTPRTDGTVRRGANAAKLVEDPNSQNLIKNEIDRLQKGEERLTPKLYAAAVRQLGELVGDSAEVMGRRMATYIEAGEVGENLIRNLPKVLFTTSTINDATQSVMRSIRDVRQANAGISVMGKTMAMRRFVESYNLFRANLNAINKLYKGVGDTMRAFGPSGRISIVEELTDGFVDSTNKTNVEKVLGGKYNWEDPNNIKVALNNFADELARLGDNDDYARALQDEVRKAKKEAEVQVEKFMKDFDEGTLTNKDIDGIEMLMENLVLAKGDPKKLKDVVMTQQQVMATLHTGHVLSNWALPLSIPIQGILGMSSRLAANWGMSSFRGNFQRVLVKYGLVEPEEAQRLFKEAKFNRDWLLFSHLYWGKGLEAAYNSFLFNRGITDPMQARRADLGMTRTGLSREEAILKSRAGGVDHTTTWAKWLVKRAEGNPKLLKSINEAITLGKVFHDYLIPGEAWKLRGIWKDIAAPGLWMKEKYGNMKWAPGSETVKNLGAHSYFPGGEKVNMSIWSQFASAGDEFVTGMWLNAAVHADAVGKVDQMIADGLVPLSKKGEAINKEIEKAMETLYQPVRAGFDQDVIGFSILDERALELTRKVNQTEELVGPLGTIKDVVEKLRNAPDGRVAFAARFVFPIINSPLVSVKQAASFAYGGELVRMPISVFREGGGYLTRKLVPEEVLNNYFAKHPVQKKHILDFESYYFSSDPKVRDKAWNAFALAAGIQAIASSIIFNPDTELTSGLDDTYKVADGRAERFQWLIWGKSIPYRYIPYLGEALALQTTMRDIVQFNPDYDVLPFQQVGTAALASVIMDMPQVSGLSRVMETFKRSSDGDPDAIPKLVAEAYTRLGSPYYGARKTFVEKIDPRRPVDPTERFKGPKAWTKGKLFDRDESGSTTSDFLGSLQDIPFSVMAKSHEYDLALITDFVWGAFKGDPDFRLSTRRAVAYGKPEETVKAKTGPWWNPIQAALGRYWWGNNDLTDPVNDALVRNLIQPPSNALYNSFQGRTIKVAINDRELNNFNHFFNTEYEFTKYGKTFKGINSYIRWMIKQPSYLKYDQIDSPYKIGSENPDPVGLIFSGASTKAEWKNRIEADRRTILKSNIDEQINKAKIQFLMGNLPNQRFKASKELHDVVINAYNGGSN